MKPREPEPLMANLKGPIRLAIALTVGFFIGFGTWASLAPLTSAAVAPGFVGIETKRQIVQHLEGGIIAEIAVHEGERIKAGDLLIRIDETLARSTYDLLEGQFIDLLAEQARLEAERNRLSGIELTEVLKKFGNQLRVSQATEIQRNLFQSRRRALESRANILDGRIRELDEQIKGFKVLQGASQRQLTVIRKEELAVETMVKKGLDRMPHLYSLQRATAEIEGQLGEIASRIAQAQMRIGETRLEILDLETRTINQVTGDLRGLTSRLADMEPRLRAAQNTLKRTEIRAPIAGTIVALQYHTIGGVVRPGGRILDIVPTDTEHMIEAKVSPADIDVVRPGLPAEIRLTAFSARTTPSVSGNVVHVSADRLIDQATQQPYYAVYVQLQASERELSNAGVELSDLYPGMPVEVMVVTGKQTAFDYLLRPVTDTFARAFREN